MAGRLEHWQYDSFVTKFDDPAIEPAYVTFALAADGKVTGVTMKAVSKIADLSWDSHILDLKPVEDKNQCVLPFCELQPRLLIPRRAETSQRPGERRPTAACQYY